ncbi:putative RNA-directed DNA polymerase from transposon X-element [Caerostris darwini]|uniref:RNA-directed DNA polymerase from transposon X-element n=1 Tax=Caerostris darwini TaxID=1538125 RepID=A0AAV4R786_9ARAC|nr:putative RNA-directed DNA polymerase from transposon X-element [Caerostris darwini]
MKKIITSDLNWYLGSNNFLTPQAGFRRYQSTHQQVLFRIQSIKDVVGQRCSVPAVFVALRLLLIVFGDSDVPKNYRRRVCNNIFSWIKNLFSWLFYAARFGDSISSFKKSDTGLPQGTAISITLFKAFMNDLPDILNSDGLTNTALFKYNFVIWCSTSKREQYRLNTTINVTLEGLDYLCTENNMAKPRENC